MLLGICYFVICSCKYNCPGYDKSDRLLISFRQNDTIIYISNTSDTIKLLVFNEYFEEKKYFRGLYMDVECNPLAYYEALDSNTSIYLKESHDWQLSVIFCEDKPYKGITFDKENDFKCIKTTNKKIGENFYPFVFEIEDLSSQRRIDRFTKVDFYGIVEFHDKKTGLTWMQII